MSGYTKLFGSIVNSSIWFEPNPTRIVWITMLAMANRDGIVEAAIPGLAARSVVSIEECEAAVEKLSSPDKHSKNPANEGRRIERVKEGWRLLNYEDYRHRMSDDDTREKARIRKQRQRERSRDVTLGHASHDIAEAKAEAYKKETPHPPKPTQEAPAFQLESLPPSKPATILDHLTPQFDTPEFKEAWQGFEDHRKRIKAPLTPRAIKLLANDLRQWGCQKSIASIDQTVKNGKWTGLFEPKDFAPSTNGHKSTTSPAGYPDFLASPEGQKYAAKYPTWESIPPGCNFVRNEFHQWMKASA